MRFKNFFALILGISIIITGYEILFTESSKIRKTMKNCVKLVKKFSPSAPSCLCQDFSELGYGIKEAEKDWNTYREDFQKISIRYILYDIETRNYWAKAKIKVRAVGKIQGKLYLLAGSSFGYESGEIFFLKRKGKWCIKRLDIPSLRDWIRQR